MTHQALVALGGNIGNVRETFDRAVALLGARGDIVVEARSSDYRTPPWGAITDQPDFINAVLQVSTSLSPVQLLARAQVVEHDLGRDRLNEDEGGPRTIDIDILAYDDLSLENSVLTLPHPRMFDRAFVLVPLAEIAPNRVIGGVTVTDALTRLDRTGIEKLAAQ